jgi:hypothetical protein
VDAQKPFLSLQIALSCPPTNRYEQPRATPALWSCHRLTLRISAPKPKRRLGADQPDHERQGVRQRHRLGVAVEVRRSEITRLVLMKNVSPARGMKNFILHAPSILSEIKCRILNRATG